MTKHPAHRGASSQSTETAGARPDGSWPIELPSWLQTPLRPTTVARAAIDADRPGEASPTGDVVGATDASSAGDATARAGYAPAGDATGPAGDPSASASEPATVPPAEADIHPGEIAADDHATADDAILGVADASNDGAPAAVASELPFLPTPSGWTDAFTALDGPIYWARLLSGEGARIKRYRRPATVVLFQIVALDRLAHQWGQDVAVQCTLQVARTISRHIRSSDHAVRLGPARFGAFLPETNEIDAINFVERCRAAVARDVGVAAETITLAIGWAGPVDGDLAAAVELAEGRLEREVQAAAAS